MFMTETIPLVDLRAQYESIRAEIDDAIAAVLESTRFIQGPQVAAFETAFAAFCGTQFAIGMASGTSALQLALQAVGIGPDAEVVTPVNTFTATAEAIVHCGARPVFVDVDADTLLIDPKCTQAAITDRTRAIVPVHLFGQMAPMKALADIAHEHELVLIPDAAQAHGAAQNGAAVGTFGRAVIFSFYPGKNLGAYGDAGAVVTNDEELAKRIRLLRDHGRQSKYEHEIVGYGERLDTLQAAILLAKLPYLSSWNADRRRVAAAYSENLRDLPLQLPTSALCNEHVYHQFVIRTPERQGLKSHLTSRGIQTGIHYPLPLHFQLAYQELGYQPGDFPRAEAAAEEILSLPIYPELESSQVEHISGAIADYFN